MGVMSSAGSQSMWGRIKGLFSRPQSPTQRRTNLRIPTPAHEVTCQHGRERIKGVLQDVSASGMRLLLSRPIPRHQLMSVRLDGNRSEFQTVQARVAWCRRVVGRFELGIEIIDTACIRDRSWLSTTLAQVGLDDIKRDRRSSRRVPTESRALIRSNASSVASEAVIIDLSEGGALVRASRILDPGVYISISSNDGPAHAAFTVEARVVRVHSTSDNTCEVSLQFVAPSVEEARAVRSFLETLSDRVA